MPTLKINVTYAQLATLISNSGLKAGLYYRITDFATVNYLLNGNTPTAYINTGSTEVLIVRAISVNQLDKVAQSESYPGDIIHYDWNPANWLADISFSTSGTIIAGWKGVIYYRKDARYNVSTHYDWRNVKLRRWKLAPVAWEIGTTYTQYAIVKGSNGKVYYSIGAGNVGNDPISNEFTLWRPLIDYNVTDLYLSWTETQLRIEHYIDGEIRNFDVPCSESYFDFKTFGTAALTSANVDLTIGSRYQTEGKSIVNNILLNVTNRSTLFAAVNFVSISENITVHAETFYMNDFGRYSYNNLIIGTGVTCFDLHFPNGGFFKNVLINPLKVKALVDFNQNVCGDGFKFNTFNQYTFYNYFARNWQENDAMQRHTGNLHGQSTKYCTFGVSFINNKLNFGKFQSVTFPANFEGNTFTHNAVSGNSVENVTFGLSNKNNTFSGKMVNVRFGQAVNANNFQGDILESYIGSLTNNVTFKAVELRKATFLDGWKTPSDALDLTTQTLLYGNNYCKLIYASGSTTDRYIIEFVNSSLDKIIAKLSDDTVLKTI